MLIMDQWHGYLFWGFLALYGTVKLAFFRKKATEGGFFRGEDSKGLPPSFLMLTLSVYITWIFARSITVCANLGAEYGIVGGLAYAIYWLCIPLTGLALYRLRTKFGAGSLIGFLTSNYGKLAAVAFSLAILIRLFNVIWSNTSVIGGYYGTSGSLPFIAAALLFTGITLAYCIPGGLRSSMVTDVIHALFFVAVFIVLLLILPKHSIAEYASVGSWKLEAGLDFLLVACLQILSYGFHDAVLTDRGFISEKKAMLKAFTIAGFAGFLSIFLFSFIGIHATLEGIPLSGNVPAALGQTLSIAAFFLMASMMIVAAGSTLDSVFPSLAKLSAKELPELAGRDLGAKARLVGVVVMIIFAVIGNLPMLVGANILLAVTLSGTMVMGLAPIFLLHGVVRPTKMGFHLSFWCGISIGILFTLGWVPKELAIGGGKNGLLLATNLYGLILCTLGYVIPGILSGSPRTNLGAPGNAG
jgi:Na+/proline symporter